MHIYTCAYQAHVLRNINTMHSFISLVAQLVKNLPVMQVTWVQFLGWEDSLEKEMATHSSFPAWGIQRTEKTGGGSLGDSKESDKTKHSTAC